jgi:hypothetical protein
MRSKITFITVLIFCAFTLSAAAQGTFRAWGPTIPFDFSNTYYKTNGVIPDAIFNRRTGEDGFSVFDKAPYEMYSNVRVTATVPAYDQYGNLMYWYPVGDLGAKSFTPDKTGYNARERAGQSPMYIFPDPRKEGFSMFTGHRHAPLIEVSKQAGAIAFPQGIRMVYVVYYTERGVGKEGFEMMQYMGKKNGWAADDTAILKTVDDIRYLEKQGFIKVSVLGGEGPDPGNPYTIAPIFENPTAGAIYPDAMLFMTMKDGRPLPAEEMFWQQFQCLQKYGTFCDKIPQGADF